MTSSTAAEVWRVSDNAEANIGLVAASVKDKLLGSTGSVEAIGDDTVPAIVFLHNVAASGDLPFSGSPSPWGHHMTTLSVRLYLMLPPPAH